jgi:uncharacterized protein YyaL (SSP411 family)
MEFLLGAFATEGEAALLHTWKNGAAKYTAFLDDYAYLIQALISLQEITADTGYLIKAKELTQAVLDRFVEKESGFFFFTPEGESNMLVRKKEVYDGATPAGNSVMAQNLFYLGLIFDERGWQQQSIRMLGALQQAVVRYPLSFGIWLMHLTNLVQGYLEIAVVGRGYERARDQLNQLYLPNKIMQTGASGTYGFPLLEGKNPSVETLSFYLCKNYACRAPVADFKEFTDILTKERIKTIK